ncbi:MAG: hypothetical protein N0E48_20485, partial [Candidatus Thiodiazotropha endolucinida]|nr:hypothetical protein [Candidatus Thiodiazotropha taylori]MCW4345711.1 hypothetical protein [Candidatus Thiodiazotropha endolucinida]
LHTTISDSDIMRIAQQVKQIMADEVERLVKERVEIATAELSSQVESLKDVNSRLREDLSKLESKLTTKIDDLEQYSRRACLRISGIKEEVNENTDQLVLDLATKLKIDLDPNDIDRSHRIGPVRTDGDGGRQSTRPREIIVKLKSYQVRLALLKGRKTLRTNREAIFINEDLTQKRKSLAYECRQLKRERKILSTWVYDGNVFVTDRSGLKVKVTQDDELDPYRTLVVPPASQDRLLRH